MVAIYSKVLSYVANNLLYILMESQFLLLSYFLYMVI